MCQMPGNVGKFSNIIIIRFDLTLLSDHIAENNLNQLQRKFIRLMRVQMIRPRCHCLSLHESIDEKVRDRPPNIGIVEQVGPQAAEIYVRLVVFALGGVIKHFSEFREFFNSFSFQRLKRLVGDEHMCHVCRHGNSPFFTLMDRPTQNSLR